MLVGLLFAIDDAEDRAGVLAATLPFGASTLLEYQARLLQTAGAAQVIVVVQRLTPELIGAVARLERRGLTVDTARDAADVRVRLHPLAQVIMLADTLATTEGVVRMLAEADGDALLTMPDDGAADADFERLGAGVRWGGVARLDAGRMADAAALPADYDLQSTLLRVAEEAGARHLPLSAGERRLGHGVERGAAALEARGRAMLAANLALGSSWFERGLVRPVARRAIPALARRMTPSAAVAGAAAVLAIGAVLSTVFGSAAIGAALAVAALVMFETTGALALLRDEDGLARACRVGVMATAVAEVGALAWHLGGTAAPLLAGWIVAAGAIGERAAGEAGVRAGWWASPPALLTVIALGAIAGQPLVGLVLGTAYATASLAAKVEALRREA